MADRKDMWDKFSSLSTIIGVLGALIGGLLFFTLERGIKLTGIDIALKAPAEQRTKDVEQIVAQLSLIEDKLNSLTKVPKDLPIAPKIAEIEADIASLKEKMAGINSVIMETPQKALQIPMIKKDLESLRNELLSGMQSIEREVSRAYDTMKWVVGTIVFGILSLAAGVFFKGRKE